MQVLQINPVEQVSVDQDRLGALYSQLGEAGAEDVVCRALEELSLRLSHSEALFRESAWSELRKNTRSLIAIAEQIGMKALSHVAGDVTYSIDRSDTVAVAATLSRLLRIGERSLTAVWDIQDITL
ncbi:hypothetical protein Z946_1954 [Sulfitobacter noctilucicola]|uniref:Hpt domain-containing protein n=1 Tax=Sulfitobacter noctilucicola TaxID=1342301 RepID=A0A7W6M657_9RHOB|nr:hypothetical protein [Sulfitobacter noctilucicola]KIN63091.1 hypothetical protein Z946_1954 [Sulfitobacter noctilucicola]MBB4172382.1 hypothetical protein [Sulfitobacter noctilucicola]